MIPKEQIEEVREKADIVPIISEYLQLKKRGKNFLALCPFHSEKTASFTVSQEKQLFHCFGCGEGGNVFAFIMKMEKVDFPEAVELVGEKIGIHIERSKGSGAAKSYRDRLQEILALACKFYQGNLELNNVGAEARAYISKRKLSPEIVSTFQLGFAEESFNSLFNHLVSRGAKTEEIEAAGLSIPRKENQGYYDRFRSRLMFPIFDLRDKVIGFSGRAIGAAEPKYLNSPDSVIFNKGGNLFGLNLAKDDIKKRKYAILVEGNIDVVSCHEAGFKTAVAPLGTAFTLIQAKLLKRFAETVVLAFDSDTAGGSAMERAYEVLAEAELLVRVMDLGKYKDPDELLKAEGAAAFEEKLKASMPAMEFKVKRIMARFDLKEAEARARAAYEVAGFLGKEKDRLLQNEYIKFSARLLGIDEGLLSAEVRKRQFYQKPSGMPLRLQTKRPPEKIAEAEKTLVQLAVRSEEALALINEGLQPEEINDPVYREIFRGLRTATVPELLADIVPEERKRIVREALLADQPEEDLKQAVKDCINTVKGFQVKKQIEKVREDLIAEEKAGDVEAVKRLNSEYHSLSEILRTMSR